MSLAEREVDEFKRTSILHQKVDEVTQLTDISADGDTITYHYDINGADTSNLTDSTLYESVKPNACKNEDVLKLLNEGINIKYIYTEVESGKSFLVELWDYDCK